MNITVVITNNMITNNTTMNKKFFAKQNSKRTIKKEKKNNNKKNVGPKWKRFGLFTKLKSCSPLNSYVRLLKHSCDGVTLNPNA